MNDLIRRDDVIKAIHGYWSNKIDELPTELTEDGEVIADMRKANEYLEHNKQLSLFVQLIKTVEVVEPKHGRWITDGLLPTTCSECGHIWEGFRFRGGNYCPNCGAKMDNEH